VLGAKVASDIVMIDEPKSLGQKDVCEARVAMLQRPHIAPLTSFVDDIRSKLSDPSGVPYFDPLDGGIAAKLLIVLEAPGPKAVRSGFVSRNNPDDTARNVFNVFRQAGFARSETAMWNIVPWYIGTGQKIRAASAKDIRSGLPYLNRLLALLPNLQGIGLLGKKAARVKLDLAAPGIQIWDTPHPSPLFVNRHPENLGKILEVLRTIRMQIR